MGECADVKLCDAHLIGEDVDGWQQDIQERQQKSLLDLLERGEHLLALSVSSRCPVHKIARRGLLKCCVVFHYQVLVQRLRSHLT